MNIDNFKRYAGPVIFRRASDYYDEGRVSLIKSDGSSANNKITTEELLEMLG